MAIPLDGLTVDGARDKIRGPKGTTVTLTIQRGGDAPFELAITRDVIQQREVVSEDSPMGPSGTSVSTPFPTRPRTSSRLRSRHTSMPGGRSSSSTCAATRVAS